jgi:hypothetical protein
MPATNNTEVLLCPKLASNILSARCKPHAARHAMTVSTGTNVPCLFLYLDRFVAYGTDTEYPSHAALQEYGCNWEFDTEKPSEIKPRHSTPDHRGW